MASNSNTRTATPPTTSGNTQASTASRQKRMQHKQPTSFQFVTFGDVDHMRDSNALSRIRRHAMKDIGLQRRKPKKKRFVEVFDLEWPPTNSDGSTEDEPPVVQGTDSVIAEYVEVPRLPSPIPAIGGGGIHTFLSLPIDLSTDPTGKELLSNIFIDDPTNTISRQTAHRNDWFFAGLKYPASFNQILANSELHTEALRHPDRWPRETEVSIRYHQRAVKDLRQRLVGGGNGGITDEMIGIAGGFVVYAEIAGNLNWWLPQRKGMVDLISIRGGSASLEYHPRLLATCSWVELRGCYMQDLSPLLPPPKFWTDAYEKEFEEMKPLFCESERSVFEAHWQFSVEWPIGIFDGVANLASKVQKRLEDGNEEGEDVLVWTNVVVHRLLNLRPGENLLQAIRLGLLLFIASIYRHYGAHPTNPRILVRKLHDVLLRDIEWGIFWQLRLWILCVAALEAVEQYDLDFFVAAIVEVRRSMPESETQGVIEATKIVLWLPRLMDGRVEELVQRVEEMRRYM